jgi:hypothetical protein
MIVQHATMKYRPRPRWPCSLFNGFFDFVDRLRSRPTFSITRDEAIRAAATISGVTDFDCDEFHEPLEMWCRETGEAHLTPFGRFSSRSSLISTVAKRLYIEKALRDEPALTSEPLQKPWFVTGLPRTGTTLMQRLLAQDPLHRAPLMWEVSLPFPYGKFRTARQRIEATKSLIATVNYLLPQLQSKHEIGAELPDECWYLLINSLIAGSPFGKTPEFNAWFWALDKTRAFELHKIQLQYLQLHSPKKRWILKDPNHILNLDYLLKVYPDARIIKLHRDPIEVLPSTASLWVTVDEHAVREIDLRSYGGYAFDYAKSVCFSPSNTQAGTDELLARGVQTIDIKYADFVADPVATVAHIYERFDCDFAEAARDRMQAYLRDNRQDKHGPHRYAPEHFGIDKERVRHEFAPYVDRYLK